MAEVDVGAMDELLRALASPQRRRMLELTWSQERTAGELSEILDLAPASASEHLKVLRKLGLVEMRAEGTFRVYRARPSKVGQLIGLLSENFPEENS